MNDTLRAEYEEQEELLRYGDPRRCPLHPDVVTSSPDGMYDAPCGKCEMEMDYDHYEGEQTTSDYADGTIAAGSLDDLSVGTGDIDF